MKRLSFLPAIAGLSICMGFSPAPKPVPGYWQVSAAVQYDWVDWVEAVYWWGEFTYDNNTWDVGGPAEYVQSYFYDYMPGVYSLQSRSEGPIRIKFEWVGGGSVPSTITFDYWTLAQAGVLGPTGTWALDSYYVDVDGHLGSSSSGSYNGISYFDVTATGTNTYSVSTNGSATVYYSAPGFVNNLRADCIYGAKTWTYSTYSITVKQ